MRELEHTPLPQQLTLGVPEMVQKVGIYATGVVPSTGSPGCALAAPLACLGYPGQVSELASPDHNKHTGRKGGVAAGGARKGWKNRRSAIFCHFGDPAQTAAGVGARRLSAFLQQRSSQDHAVEGINGIVCFLLATRMFQGVNGFGGGGSKASSGFGQWYMDMQDAKEVRRTICHSSILQR